MKTRFFLGWFSILTVSFPLSPRAAPDAAEVVAKVASWRNGEGRDALQALESLASAATDDKTRGPLADAIAAALGREASPEAKRFLCGQLSLIGSEKQIPALAALAAHPEIGLAACGALERIGGEKSAAALRGALAAADDKAAVCIVRALGVLKSAEAVTDIAARLPRFDRDGRAAAWLALGRIGTDEALRTLNTAAGSAADGEREALAQARFAAAASIANRGRSAAASKALADLANNLALSDGLRDAALVLGWKLSDDAAPALDRALGSGDAIRQAAALKAIEQIGAKKFVDLLVARTGSLPPRHQARALLLLGASGSDKARGTVRKAIASEDAWVRREAIRAAGALDDAGAAGALVERLAVADADERRALVDALTVIRGDEVNEELLEALQSAPKISKAIADILAARDTKGSPLANRLLDSARNDPGPKAAAALQALGAMGSADIAAQLMPLLSNADADKAAAAFAAVQQIYRRTVGDSGPAVLKALPTAAPAQRARLIGLLAMAAQSPETVAAARKELQGDDLETRLAVLRVLAEWKNKDLQPDLAAAAGRATDEREKALAMRALAALAPPAGGTNLAKGATADSPDGVEKDGAAGGDQAGIDGDPKTYWDEENDQPLYRYRVTLKEPAVVFQLRITGYQHENFAPKDFEVLCDDKVVATVRGAAYEDNQTLVVLPPTRAKTVELRITGSYGPSPAIRELEIFPAPAAGGGK